jgi:23S rRNA (uracil1939-C5)-methyltransferase
VALARAVGELVAIERDEPAVAALHDNLRARSLAVKVRVGDAETTPLPRAELVVLDPPRGGAVGAVRAIAVTRPRRVVYVSCNVATLARDLETLVEARYRPTSLDLFDLFPQTSHVEVVVALER